MKILKLITILIYVMFLFGCENYTTKISDDSHTEQTERKSQELSSISKNDSVQFRKEKAEFNKNYTELMRNRYPSDQIIKIDDLTSDEGDKAITKMQNQEDEIIHQVSSLFYTSFDLETDTDDKRLKIVVDGNNALENIDALKKNNLVNPEVTQVFLNTYPIMAASYVANLATSALLHNLYFIYDQLDKIKVSVFLLWNNQYGSAQEHLIYTFNFDRKLFNKISWSGFHPKNLEKVVKNLHYSIWYENNIAA